MNIKGHRISIKGIIVLFLVVFLVGLVGWCAIQRPVTIEGEVIEKDIAEDARSDSIIKIKTAEGEIVFLKFDTHEVTTSIRIMAGDNFEGEASALNDTVAVGDTVKVETFDESGLTRDVYKLISVHSR